MLALGGMGGDQAQLEATLGALSASAGKAPIVVVPGDLEPIDAMEEGTIAALVARKSARRRRPPRPAHRARRHHDRRSSAVPSRRSASSRPAAASAPRDRSRRRRADARRGDHAPDPRRLGARPRTIAANTAERADLAAWSGIAPPTPRTTGDLPPEATAGADIVLAGAIDSASAMRSGAREGTAITLAPGSADATRGGRPSAGLLVLGADHAWTWHPVTDAP